MPEIADGVGPHNMRSISIDDERGGALVGLRTDDWLMKRIASLALQIFFGCITVLGFSLALVGIIKVLEQSESEESTAYLISGCFLTVIGIGATYVSCYPIAPREIPEEEMPILYT